MRSAADTHVSAALSPLSPVPPPLRRRRHGRAPRPAPRSPTRSEAGRAHGSGRPAYTRDGVSLMNTHTDSLVRE
jgi:hypothetical protein